MLPADVLHTVHFGQLGPDPRGLFVVVDGLLDDFADRLDPLYQAAKTANQPIPSYFGSRAGEAAEALLGITDQRAQKAKNAVVKGAYEKLRPMAKKHTEAAIPRVAAMIAKHDKAVAG